MALVSGFVSSAVHGAASLGASFQRMIDDGSDAVEDGAASYFCTHPHGVAVCRKCCYRLHGYVSKGVVKNFYFCHRHVGAPLLCFADGSFDEDHGHLNVYKSCRRRFGYLFVANLNFVKTFGFHTRPTKSASMYASAISIAIASVIEAAHRGVSLCSGKVWF